MACGGATNTGAIDPLDEIAAVAARFDIWLHVDGAFGAWAALDPAYADRFRGIARADSLTLNPHKWPQVPLDCGAMLTRHPDVHRAAFSLTPDYLVAGDSEVPWPCEHMFQLTYGNRALKTWAALARLGRNGLAELVTRCNGLATLLEARVREAPDLELLAPASLSVVNFRYRPAGRKPDAAALDALNERISEAVSESGEAHLPTSRVRGQVSLRACFLHYENDESDVNHLVQLVKRLGSNMPRKSIVASACLLQLLGAHSASAEEAKNWLLVESPHSQDVQVIDTATRQVVRNIPIGEHTDDVMGSPDGRVFYVGAQDDMRSPFGYQNNESGKVMAFDSRSFKQLWSVALDGSPNHISRSPDGKRIYVPLYTRHWMVVLNAEDGSIEQWWPATIGNHATEISADGTRLYAGNMVTDAIYVYDTATGKVVMALDVGESVRPIVLDEPRGLLYYQLSRLHGFEVRRIADGSFVKRVELPALDKPVGPADGNLATRLANLEGASAWPYTYNHGLAMTRDGRHLVAVATVANYAAIYSLPDFTLKGVVPVGGSPNWVVCDREGKFAYVSNPKDDSVSVIDIEAVREVARIKVGKGPKRVAFSVE